MLVDGLSEAFELQTLGCRQLGSPLYAEILDHCREDLRRGGVIARVLDGWVGRPVADAVVLRLAGAVHRLALRGKAPQLARFYPSCGGTPEFPQAWEAFRDVVETFFDEVRESLTRQVQTNEVNRCAALMAGFRCIAARAPRRLRILEIGTSAGLNQNWDRYHYRRNGAPLWGEADSPVVIDCKWHGEAPPMAAGVEVVGRGGCDIAPLDVSDDETALRLQSFIWPDQLQRLESLRAAIDLGRRHRPAITWASAGVWLEEELRTLRRGETAVVFHSTMWWYMARPERDQVTSAIEAAGARAGADAAVAWLQLEPLTQSQPTLSARLWPGGEEILHATASAHGGEVWWQSAGV